MFEPQLESDTTSWESKEIEGRDNDCTQENFRLKQTAADASVKAANIILSDGAVDGRSFENEVGSKSKRLTEAADNFIDILPSHTSSGPNDIKKCGAPYADAIDSNKDLSGFSHFDAEELRIQSTDCQTEETEGWNIEKIMRMSGDDVEEGAEIVDMNFGYVVVLEESCVIADGENHPSDSRKELKHKSYKKKLRDAFSSRGKSMRIMKEYRQLAAKYESTANAELDERGGGSSLHMAAPDLQLKKLRSANLGESEWEIL